MAAAGTKELKLIDKASLEFAKKELGKIVEISGSEFFSPAYSSVVEKAIALDFFHISLPESAGGGGLGIRALCTALQNICTEDSSLGVMMLATIAASELLIRTSNESLLNEITDGSGATGGLLIAFPLFSNPAETPIKLTAEKRADGYVLSGVVESLVLAGIAEKGVVPATIDGQTGFSYFWIDLTGKDVAQSEPVKTLGTTACPVADVLLKEADAFLCCAPEEGGIIFNTIASELSIALAAMETGLMKGSLSEALDYTKNRRQGGRKIIHWSEVKRILSKMALNTQLAEMLVHQSCTAIETNETNWEAGAAAASAKISELACDVTSDGIRVMGGVGYMKDFNQEKRFRDSRQLLSVFGSQQRKKLNFLERYIYKSAIYNIQEAGR